MSTENTRQAIIENMLSITASIAAIVCDHLVVDRLGTRALNEDDLRLTVPTHRLLESARLLFDNPGLREPGLLAYTQDYSLQPLSEDLPPPACLVTVPTAFVGIGEKEGLERLQVGSKPAQPIPGSFCTCT